MNTAETTSENLTLDSLAAQILLSAFTTAQRLNAGDTLLFLEAYDKICTIERTGSNVIKFIPQMPQASVSIKDCTITGGSTAINAAESTLPDLGEPTPIQPIPAPTGRTRRTKAQIEADNAAAAQATAPPAAEPEPAAPELTPEAESAEAESAESAGLPEGFDGIALSNLFTQIKGTITGDGLKDYTTAVRAKLGEFGAPAVSKVASEHLAAFREFLLSFKA